MRNIVQQDDSYVYFLKRPAKPETPRSIIDENGMVVFYVGKGCKKRIFHHEWNARKHIDCKHQVCRVIRKVWSEGEEIQAVKIAEDIPEQAAFDLEKLYISIGAIYGWPLVNSTFGGEGTRGLKREVLPDEREQRRQRAVQRFTDPKEKEKMSQAAIQRFANPDEREKQSQRALQRFTNPEFREQHRQRAIERAALADEPTEEERERGRQIALKQWSDPVIRERMSKSHQGKVSRFQTYEGFVNSQNEVFAPVENLAAFCRDHDLSYLAMRLVAQGKQPSHKGWTRYNPRTQPMQDTLFDI